MKNLLPLLLLTALMVASGCTKEEECVGSDQDIATYLEAQNITAEEGERGLRYEILEPGTDPKPTRDESIITIKYAGYTTNLDTFDQTPPGETRTFALNRLIAGWQLGIPLIGSGGIIRLYIPSALAYGPSETEGDPSICGNSDLIFDVELESFTN